MLRGYVQGIPDCGRMSIVMCSLVQGRHGIVELIDRDELLCDHMEKMVVGPDEVELDGEGNNQDIEGRVGVGRGDVGIQEDHKLDHTVVYSVPYSSGIARSWTS